MHFRGLWAHDWSFLLQVSKGTLLPALCPQIAPPNLCGFLHLLQSNQMPAGLAWVSGDCAVTPVPSLLSRSNRQLAGFQKPKPANLLRPWRQTFLDATAIFDAIRTLSGPWPSLPSPQASPSCAGEL